VSWVFPLPTHAAVPQARWTLDQGVDIAAPAHTPLLAVDSGVIVRHGINGFGQWAPVLKTDRGDYVYYGHAGPGNFVKDGTKVQAGQVIGEVGAGRVGISSGPHLEIGFANATGNPIGTQTAKGMLADLKSALSGGALSSTTGTRLAGGNVTSDNESPAGKVIDSPSTAINAALNGIWQAVAGKAEYAGLFLVLLVAGAGLFFVGFTRASGLKHQGAPA
jgi:hypothetical protein